MAFLREIPKVKDPNDNKQLLNYIYALEEQLRYVYANLGAENLINGAVGADQLQAGCITTEKLSAAAGKDLKIMSQQAVRIVAKEIEQLAQDAAGNASQALQTAEGLTNRVEDAEKNSAEAVLKANEAYLKVEAVEGQADYVQYPTPTGDIKIGDTWTKVAAPPMTWQEAQGNNWSNLQNRMWGELYFDNVCYYIWDGKQWVQLVDAQEQHKVLTEVQVKADGAVIKVQELEGKTPEVLRNTSVEVDLNGIRMNTGGTFQVESGNFDVDGEGKMTAKAGSIGGWEIAPGSLKSGSGNNHVRLSTEDATYAIWAGAEAGASAPFRVTKDGKVYLTKLYVTDENGNAQANPVNLSASWWRTSRAVQNMAVEGNTLTISLYDGTTVNFKKAAVSDAEIGGYNAESKTINVVFYDDAGNMYSEWLDDGGLYDDAFEAGWEAAKAAVTVSGNISSIRNTAANYFYASGNAYAYVDGEQVASTSFSGSQVINVGQ